MWLSMRANVGACKRPRAPRLRGCANAAREQRAGHAQLQADLRFVAPAAGRISAFHLVRLRVDGAAAGAEFEIEARRRLAVEREGVVVRVLAKREAERHLQRACTV